MESTASLDNTSSRRVIEVMTEDNVRTLLEWAKEEGWNPGINDALPFRIADSQGFFCAVDAEGGTPLAGISAVRYGDTYGFIGLYICAKEFRGRGHGSAVFRHAMRYLEGRVIGLDAVAERQAAYAKQGFVLAHQTVRFGGEMTVVDDVPTNCSPSSSGEGDVVQAFPLEEYADLIVAYDEAHFPACRQKFTRAWLTTPDHIVRVAIEGGMIKGYGVLRPCMEGAKLGPLFASSVEIAELLVRALAAASMASSGSPTVKVFLDVPEPNKEGIGLADRLGLIKMWHTGRMYRGAAPILPLDRIFGVTSLELG